MDSEGEDVVETSPSLEGYVRQVASHLSVLQLTLQAGRVLGQLDSLLLGVLEQR